jgi:hypothetical protein
LASAALIAWKLTVNKVISNAPPIAAAKIHQEISARYWYFCNHPFIYFQAMGMAITHEMITKPTKSFDSNRHRSNTDAPTIFLIPISLVRCSATKEANPNSPRQEIKMARIAKKVESWPILSSWLNFLPYSSSTNR